MSEQIIKIAQVNDPILNNLVDTENKLTEVNQELVTILEDSQNIITTDPSFFNFDNPFFLLTLAGLFMLVFALWFLKKELKYDRNKNKLQAIREKELETKTMVLKKSSKSKGRKINVIKVK